MNVSGTYAALWAVVILEGILILVILQQLATIRQLSEMAGTENRNLLLGAPAPDFFGVSVTSGRSVSLENMDAQGGILLFLSTECTVCQELAKSLERGPNIDEFPIVALIQGETSKRSALAQRLGGVIASMFDDEGAIAEKYRVSSFPSAVLIDRNRSVRGYEHPISVNDLRRFYSLSAVEAVSREASMVSAETSLMEGGIK